MGCEKSEKELEAAPSSEVETYVVNLPRPLNIEEKKYLLAVERGDLANVKRFIQFANKGGVNVSSSTKSVSPFQTNFFLIEKTSVHLSSQGKSLDINCVDSLGRGALSLAIEAENLKMVELLIVMGVETKDVLLRAIDQEFVEAVELLLEHEELLTANSVAEGNGEWCISLEFYFLLLFFFEILLEIYYLQDNIKKN